VRFSSPLLALVGCWCLGQIISAQLAYWFSITLVSYGWEGVLVKSTSILLCVSCIAVLTDLSRGPESHVRLIFRALVRHVALVDVIASILIFSLSTFFYWPHLFVEDGVIKRSQVYWDFNIHFPVIQSFVLGDNFPAENMTFSGTPLTYHFFFDLLCAIYACLGLDLIQGLNWASAVSFGMMLLAIYSACIELFKSRGTAMVAVGLVLTSSSLRFLSRLAAPMAIFPLSVDCEHRCSASVRARVLGKQHCWLQWQHV